MASRAIERLAEAGRAAWPGVELEGSVLEEYLRAQGVDPEGVAHPADLYLAAACALRRPSGYTTFDREFLARVPTLVSRVITDSDVAADLQQRLRELLLWGADGRPRIAEYTGRGPLEGWLRVVAVRAALRIQRGEERFERTTPPEEALLHESPELAYLKSQHREGLNRALRAALKALGEAERELLRRYFFDGATVAELGAELGVNASTAWRRLQAIRRQLREDVHRRLAAELGLGEADFESLLSVIQSQLDLRISSIFEVKAR